MNDMPSSYLLTVAYDGSRYNGFQRQTTTATIGPKVPKRPRFDKNGIKQNVVHTIQDCLEDALMSLYSEVTLESLRMRCAGRTDAGVHARGQIVAIDLEQTIDDDNWRTTKALNSRLPNDISVERIEPCRSDIEPRQDSIKKRYSYTLRYRRKNNGSDGQPYSICSSGIHTIRRAHDPTCLWICPWSLEDSQLQVFCQALSGQHDFYAFVHKEERRKQSNCLHLQTFHYHVLDETNEPAPIVTIQFILEAKGFRRTMVRNLVGFVVDLCRGAVPLLDLVWEANEVAASLVQAAPASGLCLEKVWMKEAG